MVRSAHFQRIGTSATVRLVGHDDKRFKVEWSQALQGGVTLIEYDGDYLKRCEGIPICGEDYFAVQYAIQKFMGLPLILENFVESYCISAQDCSSDRDFIIGHDVTALTVREVIKKTGIKLAVYFEEWYRRECLRPIIRILRRPPKSVLEMRFDELHDLINWNNHKRDYVELFMAGISKE